MQHCMNVGVDLHDRTMVLRWAVDRDEPRADSFSNDPEGQERMIGRSPFARRCLLDQILGFEPALHQRLNLLGGHLRPRRFVMPASEAEHLKAGLVGVGVGRGCRSPPMWSGSGARVFSAGLDR